MKESEWPYAIAHSYEFMGKTHHMRIDEAMAIGRSGRSGTVQEYALEPGQYLHRTGATIAAKVRAMHDRPGATPPTAKDEDVALSIGPKHLTAKDRAEGQAASRELEKVARQREKDGFFIPMMWTDWEKRQLELLDRGLDPVTDGDFKRARMRKWLR